jgi:hypothetical protein
MLPCALRRCIRASTIEEFAIMLSLHTFRPCSFLIASSGLLARVLVTAASGGAPPYVPATAYHIRPETTSEESGYFSLSESLDGAIHIGTAKYLELGHCSLDIRRPLVILRKVLRSI